MSYQVKDKQQAELFEEWRFEWVNNATFDNNEDGAGHWFNGTHRIVPIDKVGKYWKFDIYHASEPEEFQFNENGFTFKTYSFKSPYLIYSGEIELEDKEWFETLLVNLGIVPEEDEPEMEE